MKIENFPIPFFLRKLPDKGLVISIPLSLFEAIDLQIPVDQPLFAGFLRPTNDPKFFVRHFELSRTLGSQFFIKWSLAPLQKNIVFHRESVYLRTRSSDAAWTYSRYIFLLFIKRFSHAVCLLDVYLETESRCRGEAINERILLF